MFDQHPCGMQRCQGPPFCRPRPEAWYDIHFAGGGDVRAFGFDVDAFDPGTPGPAFLSFFFADGDTTYTEIPILPVNPTENDPLFFGIVSDSALVRIRWYASAGTRARKWVASTAAKRRRWTT
jgi:hypothetical protein